MHPNPAVPALRIPTGQRPVPPRCPLSPVPVPVPVPRGCPSGRRERLTHAGRGPLPGAHQPPHGVVAGVAVLPVEAVPPSWRGDRGQRPAGPGARGSGGRPQGPGHRGAAGAEGGGGGAHLPGTAATADCPWTPSGSSCGHRRGGGERDPPGELPRCTCRRRYRPSPRGGAAALGAGGAGAAPGGAGGAGGLTRPGCRRCR